MSCYLCHEEIGTEAFIGWSDGRRGHLRCFAHDTKFNVLSLEYRFWGHVQKTPTCWLWTGQKNKKGYGLLGHASAKRMAHRVSYFLATGHEVPDGLQLDHLCRVRHCVNPEHLEAVTPAVNTQRGHLHRDKTLRFGRRPKTHCRLGHPMEGENLIVQHRNSGEIHRRCRTCRNAQKRRWRKLQGVVSA